MSALDVRSWAGLAVSVALHALLAFIVVVYGRTIAVEDALKPPVDVWAGDTVEIADLVAPETAVPTQVPVVEARVPSAAPPPAAAVGEAKTTDEDPPRAAAGAEASEPKLPEASRRAEADPSTQTKPVARSKPKPPPERPRERAAPEDDLAARILAYQPKPRTRPAPEATEAGGATEPPPRTGGALGASTEAGPPRNFARAFTRAIPAATTNDPAWTTLPVGSAGELEFVVEIDEEGHVAGRDVGKHPPKHLERVVDQTLLALRGGRFELTGATSGKQRLRIAVHLSDQPLDEGPLALGFRSPGPGAPGLAYFQLASGRRVDVVVTLLP